MVDMRQVAKVYRTELVETHALRSLDLCLEVMRVDFRSIGCCKKRADLVGRPVEGGGFAFCRAVEDIDEGPAKIFGVGLECGPGHHGEEIGPDRFEGLDHCVASWEIACRYGGRSDGKAGKIEPGELIGE